MKPLYNFILSAIGATLLSGCASSPDHATAGHDAAAIMPASGGPLLPLPGESLVPAHDPDDGLFMDALSSWLEQNNAPPNTQYEFTRIDLDNDGRREGLVLMQSPHQAWCMEYGCSLFLFRAHDEGFSYLSEISPVRGPLVVAESQTSGWRDLIIHVSGRQNNDARNVALKFNGRGYPSQPASAPGLAMNMLDVTGIKIFP